MRMHIFRIVELAVEQYHESYMDSRSYNYQIYD